MEEVREQAPGCLCFRRWSKKGHKQQAVPQLQTVKQPNGHLSAHPAPLAIAPASFHPDCAQLPTASPNSTDEADPAGFAPKPVALLPTDVVLAASGTTTAALPPDVSDALDQDADDSPAACPNTLGASINSPLSTGYYSAGGWSHFGDNGEWLGPPLERTASAERGLALDVRGGEAPEQPVCRAAATPVEGGVAAGDLHSLGAADSSDPKHHQAGHQHDPHSHERQSAAREDALPCVPPGRRRDGSSQEAAQLAEGTPRSPPDTPTAAAASPPTATGEGHLGEAAPRTTSSDPVTRPLEDGSNGTAAATVASIPVAVPVAAAAAAGERPETASGEPPLSLEAMLDRVADLYGIRGQPCKACQVMLSYCKTRGVRPDSLRPELQTRGMPDVEGLAKVVDSISESLADMSTEEGWQLVRDDELRLLYRHLPGPAVHAFRARCIMDAPMEQLMAVTREIDLCPTWNKYCTSAAVLKETSLTDIMAYMSMWVPWPFNSVGFVLEANGADLLEEEGWLHVAFGLPPKEALAEVQLPPESTKHRRVRILSPSCLSFKPLPPKAPGGPTRTLCRIQAYVDPGTRAVPPFIISFVLRVLSPFIYGAVQKVLASAFKSPDSPMQTRMRQRSELYNLVRDRSSSFLAARKDEDSLGPEAKAAELAASRKKGSWRRAKE